MNSTPTRSHQVRCVRGNVALSAQLSDQRSDEFTSLVNLSGTGCLLETERELAVGEVVFMRFSVPGQLDVTTEGRVARVQDKQIGVAFEQLSETQSERIVQHVVSRKR